MHQKNCIHSNKHRSLRSHFAFDLVLVAQKYTRTKPQSCHHFSVEQHIGLLKCRVVLFPGLFPRINLQVFPPRVAPAPGGKMIFTPQQHTDLCNQCINSGVLFFFWGGDFGGRVGQRSRIKTKGALGMSIFFLPTKKPQFLLF